MKLDRRSMMRGAAAGGALTLSGCATAGATAPGRVRKIATEEGFWIEELNAPLAAVIERGGPDMGLPSLGQLYIEPAQGRGAPRAQQAYRRLIDLGPRRIAEMDAAGVDMHLLSIGTPGVQMFAPEEGTALARVANDHLAEAIQSYPTRLAGLAAVAPQAPEASAREIERAMTMLKLNGVIINSHTDNLYLDDQRFWPILEAAEALDAPIYLHPRTPADGMAGPFRDYGHAMMIVGFGLDVDVHVARLMFSGALDRFPRLKLVIGHMGEAIPFWLWRLDNQSPPALAHMGNRNQLKPSEYIARQFSITTSGVFDPLALRYTIDKIGAERVMFAIDTPFEDSAQAVAFLNDAALSDAERHAIGHANAERVFKIAPA